MEAGKEGGEYMPREKEGYRDNLELLNKRFPDRDMLTISDLCPVFGYRDRRSLRGHLQRFGIPVIDNRVSKAAVARYMCG